LPPTLAGLVSALAVLFVTALVVEPATTTAGLPLSGTWRALGLDLHDAWQRFGEVRAPTALVPGFLAAAACGAGLAGAIADGLAFRARARFEALAPSFTLFVVGALLGADRFRVATAVLYLCAVLVFVLLSAPIGRGNHAWFSGKVGSGEGALLRGGLATAAIALVIGLVVGPHLPGAHSLGLVGMRDGTPNGSSSRMTVSPLVEIRNRLVDQSSTELFTVESDSPSYWRLTSLGRFDGNIWSSLGRYQPASGQLSGAPQGADTRLFQRFAIRALSSIWLPAAYRPQRFEGPRGTRYDDDSSSLLTDKETSDGLSYGVLSRPPSVTAEQLARARPVDSSDDLAPYLALPDGFPDRVAHLASDVTFGAATPYDKARALQDWFRSSFTYDLSVLAGHDDSAIERFLFVTRRGYCEQFAGSYAAMARSLGLPARVGVGFTSGARQGDGTFHVTGKEAQAWPEVYFPGSGWIPFEPTPGRAVPSGASYTGINPAAPDSQDPTLTSPATTTPSAGAPTTQPAANTPTTQPQSTPPTSAAVIPQDGQNGRGGGLSAGVLTALAIAVIAVTYLVSVPLLRRRRRHRLRAAATTPTTQVIRAWSEAKEDLSLAGVRPAAAETAHEFAVRAGSESGEIAEAMNDLAEQWAAASYSPDGVRGGAGERAMTAAETVRSELAARASTLRRLAWLFDPRPLLRGSGAT
jgi:transglutaminase-like putative cysteine protease